MKVIKLAAICTASTVMVASVLGITSTILTRSPNPENLGVRYKFNNLKDIDKNDTNYLAVANFVKSNGRGTLTAIEKDNTWSFTYTQSVTHSGENEHYLRNWVAVKKFLQIRAKRSKKTRQKTLRLEELYILRSTLFILLMTSDDMVDETMNIPKEKTNYTEAFFKIEFLKIPADILETASNIDYSKYKSKLDKSLSSTNFENYNEQDFDLQIDNITNDCGPSDDEENKIGDEYYPEHNDRFKKLKLTKSEANRILNSINTNFEKYKKVSCSVWDENSFNEIVNLITENEKNRLDSHLICN